MCSDEANPSFNVWGPTSSVYSVTGSFPSQSFATAVSAAYNLGSYCFFRVSGQTVHFAVTEPPVDNDLLRPANYTIISYIHSGTTMIKAQTFTFSGPYLSALWAATDSQNYDLAFAFKGTGTVRSGSIAFGREDVNPVTIVELDTVSAKVKGPTGLFPGYPLNDSDFI